MIASAELLVMNLMHPSNTTNTNINTPTTSTSSGDQSKQNERSSHTCHYDDDSLRMPSPSEGLPPPPPIGSVSSTSTNEDDRDHEDHSSTASSDASYSVAQLPFAHLTTSSLVQQLNDFEVAIHQKYEKEFLASASSSVTSPISIEAEQRPSAPATAPSWSDISIDSVLGEGAFSFVFQVQVQVQVPNPHAAKAGDSTDETEAGCTTTTTTTTTKASTFALKCLKAKAILNENAFLGHAMDLCNEAQLLRRFDHPHIISVLGTSTEALGSAYQSTEGYFLLLEIMERTLDDRLQDWRMELEEEGSGRSGAVSRRRKQLLLSRDAVLQRLSDICVPVAKATQYLHSHQIVLRDLKPENIGFDLHRGQVKLFDFGLARDVRTVATDDVAGSVCYMAPETLLEQGTYLASDIYSLTLIVWEVCTLQTAFARWTTIEQIRTKVAKGNWRPSTFGLPSMSSSSLRKVISKGWAKSWKDRPTATQLLSSLEDLVLTGASGTIEDPVHNDSSTFSTHSLPPSQMATTTAATAPRSRAYHRQTQSLKYDNKNNVDGRAQGNRRIPKLLRLFGRKKSS